MSGAVHQRSAGLEAASLLGGTSGPAMSAGSVPTYVSQWKAVWGQLWMMACSGVMFDALREVPVDAVRAAAGNPEPVHTPGQPRVWPHWLDGTGRAVARRPPPSAR